MSKNALISVFDKQNLDALVPYLEKQSYHIYTTGGTMKTVLEYVKDKSIVYSISDYTDFPEICQGRVKTLHPRIYGGILGLRSNAEHLQDLMRNNVKLFDLVVVNLYPFEKVLAEDVAESLLLDNIDIGGHTLLRASCKNYKYISVLSDPAQYDDFMNKIISNFQMAKLAMKQIMQYDIAINNWFNHEDCETIGHTFTKTRDLKYGLNPYMKPSYICTKNNDKLPFEILNGNIGYINLLDMNYAIRLVLETKNELFTDCCASFKHNSPAGVAITDDLTEFERELYNRKDDSVSYAADTLLRTRNVDPKSSFGDIIGFSGIVDKEMAIVLKRLISDGIIAAHYTDEALDILKTKKDGNYLIVKQSSLIEWPEYRDINGVTLVQPTNSSSLNRDILESLPDYIQIDMILGYTTLKYTQSNSVCFVYMGRVIGIGAGQQNRVDCIRIAGEKARQWLVRHKLSQDTKLTLISDAFLPFVDNVEVANEYNVKYILQPGGSIKDADIDTMCQKYDIQMILSNQRIFTH